MKSTELVPYLSDGERFIGVGAASTDMTLIYNTHGTPADAAFSLEHVQPDSIVFIEGYSTGKTQESTGEDVLVDYESYFHALNGLRLEYGKDHPAYGQCKDAILRLTDILAAEYVPKDETDFTLHGLARIKGLVEKDCLVFYADYKDFNAEHASNPEEAREYNQKFHELARDSKLSDSLAPITGSSIGGALRDLMSGVTAEIVKHDVREHQAAQRSLLVMGHLAGLPTDEAGLRRSEDGRLVAYTMYGTAHARSLTQQFIAEGMDPKAVIVESIPEHQYLDVVSESGYTNYRRRIGHAALSTIAYQLTHPFIAPAVVQDSYKHLEFLNEASQGERLSFYVSCARIQQLLGHRNQKTAEEEYLALMRSFMPHSTAFKPPKTQTVYPS